VLAKGAAKKVIIHLNEDTKHHIEPLWSVIFSFLKQKRIAGASVIRPVTALGSRGQIHDVTSEYAAHHLPIRIEFIESADRVEDLMPFLYDLVTDGTIEVQDTMIVKSSEKGEPAIDTQKRGGQSRVVARGPAKLVRIYLGESDKYGGEPLYEVIVKKLRMLDFAGATVYRGILGYGVKRHTHKAGLLHFSRDLPIMISIIEAPTRIDELVATVEELIQDGLIAVSDVEMYRTAAAEVQGNA
jgi:PII-like signaling protein